MPLASRSEVLCGLGETVPTVSISTLRKEAPAFIPRAQCTGEANSVKPPHPVKQPLVWLDLEMTGLNFEKDTIVEIACVVSSGDLRRVFQGPDIAIHHSEKVLMSMNDWSQEHHTSSGLINLCRESDTDLAAAEQTILNFVKRHCLPRRAILAGNSVATDKAFLRKHMPDLDNFFHFRIVDVSSIHELCKRWCHGKLDRLPKKEYAHTAMADIMESLAELRYYRCHIFDIQDQKEPVVHRYIADASNERSGT